MNWEALLVDQGVNTERFQKKKMPPLPILQGVYPLVLHKIIITNNERVYSSLMKRESTWHIHLRQASQCKNSCIQCCWCTLVLTKSIYEQEIKINACRVVMKVLIIVGLFLTYYLSWGFCDYCILITTLGSCAGSCSGMTFLFPSCWAGILASLLRGFRLGNELATVNVHWKI